MSFRAMQTVVEEVDDAMIIMTDIRQARGASKALELQKHDAKGFSHLT